MLVTISKPSKSDPKVMEIVVDFNCSDSPSNNALIQAVVKILFA